MGEETKAEEVKVEVQEKQTNYDDDEGKEFGKADPNAPPFVPSKGLTDAEADELRLKWGKNELAEKHKSKLRILFEQFTAPMPMMIWCAVAIEGAIENWPDFGILLALQFINGGVGFYETTKAGDAVAALKKSLKPNATCKRNGKWATIDATFLVPGDLVVLASGGAVPADCRINAGRIEVDQSGLTGESLPVAMVGPTGQPKMGSTVTRGEVEATVEFTGAYTFFGKTAAMIQSVEEMSHFQKVLLKIMFFLLAVSFVLCGVILIYLLARLEKFVKALSYVVVLLVASIPLAIEVVTTTTMAIGSRELAAGGAIVARLAAIEELAGMNMLCSDKTGTLTLNKMVIQEETPIFKEGMTQYEVLRMAALAAKWHEPPKDALDTLVLGSADLKSLDSYEMLDYMPFDPIEKRTEGTIKGPDGEVFKTTKGAPHIIVKLCNDHEAHGRVMKIVDGFAQRGVRSLAVARSRKENDKEWEMLGILTFLDPPRPGTKEVLFKALEYGIDVKMITGDHVAIAKECCRQLGLGTNILNADGLPTLDKDGKPPKDLYKLAPTIIEADGFAQVFPEHKFLIVEALRQQGFAVGMTGDGVNDAPALKKADIGVAVQGATDAARAAADIVLTSPGLTVVIDAITISRCIFQRIQNFVLYRVACTLQLLVFFFIAVLAFHPNEYANEGKFNVLVGTEECDPPWSGKSHDGSNIAWHAPECPIEQIFVTNPANPSLLPTWTPGSSVPSNTGPPNWVNGAEWLGGDVFCAPAYRIVQHVDLIAEPFVAVPIDGSFKGLAYNSTYYNMMVTTNVNGSIVPVNYNATLQGGWMCSGRFCEERWPKYFNLPVIALIIITLLNDGTIISIAYDHVEPSKYPEKWNLPVSYVLSSVLGGVACGSSILLLALCLDSHNPDGTWHKGWGCPQLSYGGVVACLYLKVSLSDFLTLFSARTTRFFFSIRPARALVIAAIIALGTSTLLAALWPFNEEKDTMIHGFGRGSDLEKESHRGVLGVVWLYVFIWWIVQDLFKIAAYLILEKFDILHHKTSMFANIRGDEEIEQEHVNPEAREMAFALVENKLVAARVRDVQSTVTTLEMRNQEAIKPKLMELEAAINKRHNEQVVAKKAEEIVDAVHGMDIEERKKLRAQVAEIKVAAQRAAYAGSVRDSHGSFRDRTIGAPPPGLHPPQP